MSLSLIEEHRGLVNVTCVVSVRRHLMMSMDVQTSTLHQDCVLSFLVLETCLFLLQSNSIRFSLGITLHCANHRHLLDRIMTINLILITQHTQWSKTTAHATNSRLMLLINYYYEFFKLPLFLFFLLAFWTF